MIGSGTVLDTARFRYLLSEHLHVDSGSVHAMIIGEHGDSELAVWSGASVSGIEIHHFCEIRGFFDHEKEMNRIYRQVRDSAYEIIERKGATYYGVAMLWDGSARASSVMNMRCFRVGAAVRGIWPEGSLYQRSLYCGRQRPGAGAGDPAERERTGGAGAFRAADPAGAAGSRDGLRRPCGNSGKLNLDEKQFWRTVLFWRRRPRHRENHTAFFRLQEFVLDNCAYTVYTVYIQTNRGMTI